MIDRLFTDPAGFAMQLVLMAPALLVAVTLHEVAHALVADRLGDPTARLHGRLTLNPLPHIDPLGALCFVLAGFGWAKPVPVNAHNLRRPVQDMAWVAVAGPLSNFAAAFAALLALVLFRQWPVPALVGAPIGGMLAWIYQFNLALGIFNLIPLPPLDGGHFLPYLLPRVSWTLLHTLERYGPFLLLLMVMTGATSYVLRPVMSLVSHLFVWLVRLVV